MPRRTHIIPATFTDEDVSRNSFDQLEALANALASNVRDTALDMMREIKREQMYGKNPSR